MSGSIDKTKLGAGDGLRTPNITNSKLRTPVPSSRRFTPRTGSLDNERADLMKQRLQEAIDSVSNSDSNQLLPKAKAKADQQYERTPIRCKRAQTLAEITPSKKVVVHLQFGGTKEAHDRTMTKKSLHSGKGKVNGMNVASDMFENLDTEDAVVRERDAGRRVFQELLLNAWRHRRRDAVLLIDSSTLLQQKVQQLQMQVDVLQQLRQSEGRRRSEAAQENCQIRTDLQECEQKCQELIQGKGDLLRQQEQLENDLTDLKMELAAEQDNAAKITQDLIEEEQHVLDGITAINDLKNEKETLGNKIKSLEDILQRENKKIKNLSCDVVNLENTIHGEMLRNKKYIADLDSIQNLLKSERDHSKKLTLELATMEHHQAKNAQKMAELKKRVTVINEIKRRVLQDNSNLKRTVAEMQILLQKEREKPWWRTSGQLMYAFIHNAAYLLLPNLPKNNVYAKKTIAATNLSSNKEEMPDE